MHPFPSLLNAALVGMLVLVAGGEGAATLALSLAMLGFQVSIGTVNDLVDERLDARTKPWKPIPSGVIGRPAATVVAMTGGLVGIGLSALHGPIVLGLGLAMYACGLGYDLVLKPTALAPLAYAVAFPLLPVYAWLAASGELPPRVGLLLPVAALAGPTLQLANGMVDLESDGAAGLRGPAVRLGRRAGVRLLALLVVAIHGIAWSTTLVEGGAPPTTWLALLGASSLATAGVVLSSSADADRRERGWQAQAAAIVVLGAGWLAGAAQLAGASAWPLDS